MKTIDVFDTTLRDGEQSAGVNLHGEEKVEIACQLEELGVDVMEAGFPASSRGDFLAVSRIAQTIRRSSVAALARSTQGDIEATRDALLEAVHPRIHLFIATSALHMEYKLRMTPDQVIERAVASVRYASAQRFADVEWSAEDATRSDWAFLARIVTEVIDAGATVINLPDTVGYATPQEYGALFRYIREHVPNIHRVKLSAHCHDDLGLAVANTLAAIESGADQVECTINGIGERAGNASLEEVAVALAIRQDVLDVGTRLRLQETVRTSRLVAERTGLHVPPNKAVVGANAFAHESGIHQDGILKHKGTYEIISPEMIGLDSNLLVLGKHSGRHAFKEKCRLLGMQMDEAELNTAFRAFKELTEHQKEVTDRDILNLVPQGEERGA
jgi:2-isopropylmalate synthase